MLASIREKLRERLRDWVFAPEVKALEEETQKQVDAKVAEHIANLDVKHLLREHLKGFDPVLLDNNGDILDDLVGEDDERVFLSDMRTFYRSKSFKKLIDFLVRNQILKTTIEARSQRERDFGLTTIDGIKLVEELIARLNAIWEEKNKRPSKFDKNEVM